MNIEVKQMHYNHNFSKPSERDERVLEATQIQSGEHNSCKRDEMSVAIINRTDRRGLKQKGTKISVAFSNSTSCPDE